MRPLIKHSSARNLHRLQTDTYPSTIVVIILFGYAMVFGAWNRPLLALGLLLFFTMSLPRLWSMLSQSWAHWRIMLLTAWAAASISWSPLPQVTSEEALFQAIFVATCFMGACLLNGKQWAGAMRYAAYAGILANVAYVLAFPGQSQGPNGLRSYFPEKNNLGTIMGLSIALLLGSPNKRLIDYSAIGIAMALLLLSESKTSITVSMILPLVYVLLWVRNRYYLDRQPSFGGRIIASLMTPIPGILFIASALLVIYREEVTYWLLGALTPSFLTGRGELWITVLRRSADKMLTGHGLGVFWTHGPGSEVSLTDFYLRNPLWVEKLAGADGGYIDIVGSLGYIGLFLLLITIVHATKLLFKLREKEDAAMLAAMLMFPVLHNITESTFFLSFNVIWMSFLLSVFSLTLRSRNEVRENSPDAKQILHSNH